RMGVAGGGCGAADAARGSMRVAKFPWQNDQLASASHRRHRWLVCCGFEVWQASIRRENEQDSPCERPRCYTGELSSTGLERRLSAVELLPPLALELAGVGQGGFPGAREHRFRVRPLRAQPLAGDAAAER